MSFPLLTALFDVMAIIGGYFTRCHVAGKGRDIPRPNPGTVDTEDVMGAVLKAVIFAVMVSTICSFEGYFTHMRAEAHGARSVSLSTTAAVVLSCVVV